MTLNRAQALQAPFFAPQSFSDAASALARAREIYEAGTACLREALQRFVAGEDLGPVRACYPFVRLRTDTVARAATPTPSRLAYGFVAGPGVYETTLTRPDLFGDYYLEQFQLLLDNHGQALEVGSSTQPIPLHFSLSEHEHVEGSLSAERRLLMRDVFDLPDLAAMDDGIANGTHRSPPGAPGPWPCSPRRGWTTPCTACATTPAARPGTSRTSCSSPTTSSTSTSSAAWARA